MDPIVITTLVVSIISAITPLILAGIYTLRKIKNSSCCGCFESEMQVSPKNSKENITENTKI